MFQSLNLQLVKPEEVGSDAAVFAIKKSVLLDLINKAPQEKIPQMVLPAITYLRGLMVMKGDYNFKLVIQTGNMFMPVFKIYITMKGN